MANTQRNSNSRYKSAPTKRKPTRKKKKNNSTKAMIFIILLIIVVGLVYIFRDVLKNNAEEYRDKSFDYPTDYEEYVLKYSKEYDMDPRFVFAIIRTESRFDPDAESDVGARGLMQIMAEAYDWLKYRLDDDRNHTYDDMFDEELNIEYGTFYLKYLYDKFDGSYELVAAAYNGGMNAVDSWIDDGTIDPDNFDYTDIPYSETSHYVKKVMDAYDAYKERFEEGYDYGEQENVEG